MVSIPTTRRLDNASLYANQCMRKEISRHNWHENTRHWISTPRLQTVVGHPQGDAKTVSYLQTKTIPLTDLVEKPQGFLAYGVAGKRRTFTGTWQPLFRSKPPGFDLAALVTAIRILLDGIAAG